MIAGPFGGQGKLDIAASLDAECPDDPERCPAQQVVFLAGESLARRHYDAVAGMDAHGVEVLHPAHHDAVVHAIPDDLELDLAPALQVLLHQTLTDRTAGQSPGHGGGQFRLIAGDAASLAPQGVGRSHHEREIKLPGVRQRFRHRSRRPAGRTGLADFPQQRSKSITILAAADGGHGRSQQGDPEFVQDPRFGQLHGEVEAHLSPERRQQSLRALAPQDHLGHGRFEGFQVDTVGHGRVGHDGGRVGVHQDDLDTQFSQRPASLASRVIELRRLTNDDRT